jgi:hypothetical protein
MSVACVCTSKGWMYADEGQGYGWVKAYLLRGDETSQHWAMLSSYGSGPSHFPKELSDVRGRTRVGSGPDAAVARVYRVRSP